MLPLLCNLPRWERSLPELRKANEALWKHQSRYTIQSGARCLLRQLTVLLFRFLHLSLHIDACHLGTFDIMKGIQFFLLFLVLSASLLCTSEAARSRTSNQNSFRRAANGIYQTLSSLFGEDNIKGLYKVRQPLPPTFPTKRFCLTEKNTWGRHRGHWPANRKLAGSGPTQQFNECRFGISALARLKWFIDLCHLNKTGHIVLIRPWSPRQTVAIYRASVSYAISAAASACLRASKRRVAAPGRRQHAPTTSRVPLFKKSLFVRSSFSPKPQRGSSTEWILSWTPSGRSGQTYWTWWALIVSLKISAGEANIVTVCEVL